MGILLSLPQRRSRTDYIGNLIYLSSYKEIGLSETAAKAAIYDLLQQRVVPSRLFQSIHQAYFEPQDTWLDCKPRTVWGLHNACTRVAKTLDMSQRFAMTLALGGHFNL